MVNRREFIRNTAGGLAAGTGLFGMPSPAAAGKIPSMKTQGGTETTTICPYCGVGCGLIVTTKEGRILNIEGDPEHPVNEGSLCSKGMALYQLAVNERRLQNVRYRAPGSDRWEEKSWEWALPEIARRIKTTRDATFRATDGSKTVNRTEGIACLGGAALDTEECYLYSKLARALGIVYLEHQARI